jgi:hypothetical protein
MSSCTRYAGYLAGLCAVKVTWIAGPFTYPGCGAAVTVSASPGDVISPGGGFLLDSGRNAGCCASPGVSMRTVGAPPAAGTVQIELCVGQVAAGATPMIGIGGQSLSIQV